MKIFETTRCKPDGCGNGGYVSIHDDGFQAERLLYIEDDAGRSITLKNEQIGQLYKFIKPGLAG